MKHDKIKCEKIYFPSLNFLLGGLVIGFSHIGLSNVKLRHEEPGSSRPIPVEIGNKE